MPGFQNYGELINPGFIDEGTVVLTGGGTINCSGEVEINAIRNGEVLYEIDGYLVNSKGEIVGIK